MTGMFRSQRYRLTLMALLFPQVLLASPLDERQAELFGAKCVQCHARPETTAPVMGVPEDWQAVMAQEESLTLKHVVEGLNGMPPLGYCSACTEEDLLAMIRFMSGNTEK